MCTRERTAETDRRRMATDPLRVIEPRKKERRPALFRLWRGFGSKLRRMALFVGFIAFSCLLVPRDPAFEVMTLREGYPAKRDLIAPFQFYLLKDKSVLRHEQTLTARGVSPVYSVDPAVGASATALLDTLRAGDLAPAERGHARLRSLGLSSEAVRVLAGQDRKRIVLLASPIPEDALRAGILPEMERARATTHPPGGPIQR